VGWKGVSRRVGELASEQTKGRRPGWSTLRLNDPNPDLLDPYPWSATPPGADKTGYPRHPMTQHPRGRLAPGPSQGHPGAEARRKHKFVLT